MTTPPNSTPQPITPEWITPEWMNIEEAIYVVHKELQKDYGKLFTPSVLLVIVADMFAVHPSEVEKAIQQFRHKPRTASMRRIELWYSKIKKGALNNGSKTRKRQTEKRH